MPKCQTAFLIVAAVNAATSAVFETDATTVSVGAQKMNMSVVYPPSLLPHFVDMTPHAIADDHLGDTCPDDIWANLINQSYPSLPYRRIDD